MATLRPLIFQDENVDVLPKKLGADATSKRSRMVVKKGEKVVRPRKALNDITNKSSIHHGTTSKDRIPKEAVNIAEEMCLHDHNKCIEAQQKEREPCPLDLVLPWHDSVSPELLGFERAKTDPESPRCYPEPIEIPMSKFNDWLGTSTQWVSPPSSPLMKDSLLSSLFSCTIEPNFVLKEGDD